MGRHTSHIWKSKMNEGDTEKPKTETSLRNIDYLDLNDRGYRMGEKPAGGLILGVLNFLKEFGYILVAVLNLQSGKEEFDNDKHSLPESLGLKLSNEAVSETERLREAAGLGIVANPVSRLLYDIGCFFLDKFFDDRPIQRFWFLETVARIPYFSYVSMLHLYESFGWLRQPSMRKVHNAEEWNELHHLLIMESLGGDKEWKDRFIGYHAAIVYYWLLVIVYAGSPRVAYQFMELLEAHAVDTYGTFLRENAATLRSLPAPNVARSYYLSEDLYFFDDFQVTRAPGTRRPPCDNMYDVFKNILDDEAEHVNTMRACQEYCISGDRNVVSPFLQDPQEQQMQQMQQMQQERGGRDDSLSTPSITGTTTTVTTTTGRQDWNDWAKEVNEERKDVKS
eukprot:CAMPEP_0174982810 /NCGR_PEP_ID=MMETSP0004_2-20121128/16744_1 /TAXON_ID=420556 /ORGANISM="Ochromonas sp., Strain CCMP1393" /LENGTH=393 /DNA_ID=CAMNT_0016234891 /DNA_START=72 /DNA_END=1253 /DNA_ORIENTATION=-